VNPHLGEATEIIDRHLNPGRRRGSEGNADIAQSLDAYGYLAGGYPGVWSTRAREAVVNILQCRMPQSTAEAIAADLDAAGLLASRSVEA
jgi:hypothetical protein